MKFLGSKFITFEKTHFPTLFLERTMTPQLIAFELKQKPYVLSFQPIQKSDPAFYLDVYERIERGQCAGHFYGQINDKTLHLGSKEIVPKNEVLNQFARNQKIQINQFKRDNYYTFALETKENGKGLGTLLFYLGYQIAKELYGCKWINANVVSDYRGFYVKLFIELGIESIYHPDSRVLLGKW